MTDRIDALEERVAALEDRMGDQLDALKSRVAALEARVASGGNAGNAGGDTLPLAKLHEPWADKEIKRVPSTWKHRNVVGKMYSDLTAEEALDLAGFYDWKAKRGREEVPVRMNNKGKPWHESDSFESKLMRTWALQKSQPAKPDTRFGGASGFGANAKHTGTPEPESTDGDNGPDSEIPF